MVAPQARNPRILREEAVQELRGKLRGELLVPGDEGYDAAYRVWNGIVDKRLALIARAFGRAT
jgi:hypothetical protein